MPTARKTKARKESASPQTANKSAAKRKPATGKKQVEKRQASVKSGKPHYGNASGQKPPPRGNGAAERAATSTRAGSGRKKVAGKHKAPVKELALQTVHDYKQAKKALGQLWEDVAKTTYSAFNSIAANVEKRYEQSRRTISEIDVHYALDKTGEKLKTLKSNASNAAQQLGRQVKLLYQMLKDATSGKFKAPWATVSAITAALLYFVSPVDLLPDFVPGAGLIDDALVIALCVSVIRMDLRRYAKENNLDLAEHGL